MLLSDHCRLCGEVVCRDCGPMRDLVNLKVEHKVESEGVRVCQNCLLSQSSRGSVLCYTNGDMQMPFDGALYNPLVLSFFSFFSHNK